MKYLIAIYDKDDMPTGVYDSIKETSQCLKVPIGTIKSWISRTKYDNTQKTKAYKIESG